LSHPRINYALGLFVSFVVVSECLFTRLSGLGLVEQPRLWLLFSYSVVMVMVMVVVMVVVVVVVVVLFSIIRPSGE
jgi:hypothetical protein